MQQVNDHSLEKHRIFSIIAYCDLISPVQARVIYLNDHFKEHGDISLERVRQLFIELTDQGWIERVGNGVYRRRVA